MNINLEPHFVVIHPNDQCMRFAVRLEIQHEYLLELVNSLDYFIVINPYFIESTLS